MQRIRLEVGSLPSTRVFRNNVGQGWAGRLLERTASRVTLADPYPLQAGLCIGSPDLVGWHTVTIPASWVGSRRALFLGLEVKTAIGRPTLDQERFLAALEASGGVGGIVRSPADALALLMGVQ